MHLLSCRCVQRRPLLSLTSAKEVVLVGSFKTFPLGIQFPIGKIG